MQTIYFSIVTFFTITTVAMAQSFPGAVIDDLEARAKVAIIRLEHQITAEGIRTAQYKLRVRLERALNSGKHEAFQVNLRATLHRPNVSQRPLPAIIHVRLHEAGDNENYDHLLSSSGVIVLSIDLRSQHDSPALLHQGIIAQEVFQRSIRTSLAILRALPEVDRSRIGLVGSGFAITLAAALNPEI